MFKRKKACPARVQSGRHRRVRSLASGIESLESRLPFAVLNGLIDEDGTPVPAEFTVMAGPAVTRTHTVAIKSIAQDPDRDGFVNSSVLTLAGEIRGEFAGAAAGHGTITLEAFDTTTDAVLGSTTTFTYNAAIDPPFGATEFSLTINLPVGNGPREFGLRIKRTTATTNPLTGQPVDIIRSADDELLTGTFTVDGSGAGKPRVVGARLAAADGNFVSGQLPVLVTDADDPLIDIQIVDQRFKDLSNTVTVRLFTANNTLLSEQDVILPPTNNEDVIDVSFGTSLRANLSALGRTGEQGLYVQATDSAGNVSDKFNFTVFVGVEPESPTQDAPGTPVFSTQYFLGATMVGAVAKTPVGGTAVIVVDRNIPVGFTINIDGARYEVTASNPKNGTPNFKLRLNRGTDKDYSDGQHVSWLRPWTTAFDKTTQTTWFTMEDGHRLGQFDPATGKVYVYDVNLTGGTETSATDPHGVFFDFNTHLTPRVWFVYRNQNADDTPLAVDETARLAYLDLATGDLVTFDFALAMGDDDDEEDHHHIEGSHFVLVDELGTVWITAEHSNKIIEVDFSHLPDGSRTSSLNSRDGRIILHELPDELGDRGATNFDFHVHGLQVVVDQRTGDRWVWASDANTSGLGSTGRVALLRPGQPGTSPDRWYEWDVDEAFVDQETRTNDGHILFMTIDDSETPGIPEDDRVIFADSGPPNPARPTRGVVRILEPGSLIKALQSAQAMPDSSLVQTVRIGKLPGVRTGVTYAAAIQTFVDREGNIYFVDANSGLGRLNPDDSAFDAVPGAPVVLPNPPFSDINAPIRAIPADGDVAEPLGISMVLAKNQITRSSFDLDIEPLTTDANTLDRSQSIGIDQYELSAKAQRGARNEGVFRGFLNAANVMYSSLSQSDYIATTVFAETSRRQMDVVASPSKLNNGEIRGRMAFSVRRDGSLILTGRGDGSILDQQVNLSKFFTENLEDNRFLFDGEPSAAVNKQGRVAVFGVAQSGELVLFQFKPRSATWTTSELTNPANWKARTYATPAGALLIGEPTAYVDSTGQFGAFSTTESGHLVWYRPALSATPLDLTATRPTGTVFSSVAVLNDGGKLLVYGTNQKGDMVQYKIPENATAADDARIKASIVGITDRPSGQDVRDTMVFQDVYASLEGSTRHVFAIDGNARLVHIEITPGQNEVFAENVTEAAQADNRVYGYFSFQQSADAPFGGRVYTEIAPLVAPDGTIYVYGTNGQDLVEFIRTPEGEWQAANLTNDVYSTAGTDRGGPNQPPLDRVPANVVFGAPAAYLSEGGRRHVLLINADGEVVEYYYQQSGNFARFHTQNVNLRLSPIAVADKFQVSPGVPLEVLASGVLKNDRDPSNKRLEAHLVSGPANGTLDLRPDGSFTYTPNSGFVADAFRYEARNGIHESGLVKVKLVLASGAALPATTLVDASAAPKSSAMNASSSTGAAPVVEAILTLAGLRTPSAATAEPVAATTLPVGANGVRLDLRAADQAIAELSQRPRANSSALLADGIDEGTESDFDLALAALAPSEGDVGEQVITPELADAALAD